MKENLRSVLVTSIILQCLVGAGYDPHSVRLVPSPYAEVKEGDALTLNCSYSGSNNPDYINWYLDNDTYGLVIKVSSCKYQTRPQQYEIHRYNTSCNGNFFTLSIANITKDKDHNATWKCDTTIIGMDPPLKASTKVVVKDAGKNGHFDEPKSSVVMWIVGGISAVTVVIIIVIAGYFHYRKRRNDHQNKINKDHHEVHLADFHEVHHEDHHEDYADYRTRMGNRLETR